MQRIGVFICWCGSNISATVDVVKVAEVMKNEPGVVYSANYQYIFPFGIFIHAGNYIIGFCGRNIPCLHGGAKGGCVDFLGAGCYGEQGEHEEGQKENAKEFLVF